MANATLDTLTEISGRKERGRWVELTREAIVTGLTSTSATGALSEVVSASGLPTEGSALVVGGDVLYLDEIAPSIERGNTTIGRATLVYRRRESSASEDPDNAPTLSIEASLKQVQTAVDRSGNPIVVEYTWPDGATQTYANGSSKAGTVEAQGGTISVQVPMASLSGSFRFATSSPGAKALEYVGKVNSTSWQGLPARTWLCTRVSATLVDETSSPNVWEFTMQFDHDPEGWDNDTTAVFIDSSTGKPPQDVDLNTENGIKQIVYYDEKNFNDDF